MEVGPVISFLRLIPIRAWILAGAALTCALAITTATIARRDALEARAAQAAAEVARDGYAEAARIAVRQAADLQVSRDRADAEADAASRRISSARDACLDQSLPVELLDD